MTASTLKTLSAQLAAKEVSAVELARHYLARIEARANLNAFIHVDPEATLAQ
ncbi:Asp-tRNA(Asn)/Glu-tRNA(Gln) amidotransferase GatCAB subunit A, partial [Ralstonia pseudosolanacearum]